MKRWLVVLSLFVALRPALAAPAATCKPATGKVRADFKPEVELKDLVTWVMGVSCKNVILGDSVDAGTKVAILAPNPMTLKQALALFADAVDAAGFEVQDKGDNLVIKVGIDSAAAYLDREIKKVDDTHVVVSADLLEEIRRNQLGVSKGGTLVQAYWGGKPVGYKLYSAKPFSLYVHLGLANGDVVQTINGMPLTTLEQAVDAYNKLHDATTFELGIDRRGTPRTITITVK
jgi:hypothetical protein